MAKKYLTLRAELVETGKRECEKCIFGAMNTETVFECGLRHHPKYDRNNCKTGYWKEINLNE